MIKPYMFVFVSVPKKQKKHVTTIVHLGTFLLVTQKVPYYYHKICMEKHVIYHDGNFLKYLALTFKYHMNITWYYFGKAY